ncbi:MAG: Hsp20/alpha crystallin family protein [Solirubrobacterales bacterium]
MTLVRWEPTRELDSLHSEVNRVFDAFFGNGNGFRARRWTPPMDLVETDEHLVLRADLPGLERDDVSIEVRDGTLTVSGERRSEHEEKSEGFYRVERAQGAFSRSLSLPRGVDAEQIDADFDRGVLEVRIPKPAESKPHRVAIGGGDVSDADAS